MHNVPLLLGAQCSRYSARVRSCLIKKNIQYVERVPTLWTYKWTIARRFGDAQIPVLIMPDGEWLYDSSAIVDRLELLYPDTPMLPADPVHAVLAQLLDLWGSEMWVAYDLPARWIHAENYPWWREELGEGMFPGFAKRLKNRASDHVAAMIRSRLPDVGYSAAAWPAIETWAERLMAALDAHFATHPYLLGANPTRADLGLICGFYGHIVQDRWTRREVLPRFPHLHAWIWRMNRPELEPAAPRSSVVAATLEPVLASVFGEFIAYLQATCEALHRLPAKPVAGSRLPRFLGPITVDLGTGSVTRSAQSNNLWRLRRILDFIDALPVDDAARVREALHARGGGGLLDMRIAPLAAAGLAARWC
jgi:glutathione S-transferase